MEMDCDKLDLDQENSLLEYTTRPQLAIISSIKDIVYIHTNINSEDAKDKNQIINNKNEEIKFEDNWKYMILIKRPKGLQLKKLWN